MNDTTLRPLPLALLTVLMAASGGARAAASVAVQCPGDIDGDAVPDRCLFGVQGGGGPNTNNCKSGPGGANGNNPAYDPNVRCRHLTAGDGFSAMADGRVQYMFGFGDVTALKDGSLPGTVADGDIADTVLQKGTLFAHWPAPVIAVNQGEKLYLSLTNVGMLIRPDLFDPHTVHFHGFPNAAAVFDGLPESGLAIGAAATLTYYYDLVEPGTFMYHCHVEATEHMQMGMLGSLYVRAGQNRLPNGTTLGSWVHTNNGDADNAPYGDWPNGPGDVDNGVPGVFDEGTHDCYAYNDGDGSTRYSCNREYHLQLGGFDPDFHDSSWFVQPLPFALMKDRYPMINGRGYPDTINPNALATPTDNENCGGSCNNGVQSQVESSLITVTKGENALLRLSNLNVTTLHTLVSPSLPLDVVGIDSRELRTPDGTQPLHYKTNSLTLGGGMAADVILRTQDVPAGEYYLYAANLQYLANNDEPGQPTGGMMTKIVVNNP